jgi:YgiT-type zinc finger domain-containing protein
MKRCPLCKSTDLHQVEQSHAVTVPLRAGPLRIVVTGIPAVRCSACGEGTLDLAELSRAELMAAAEVANRGLREGGAFRFMRKATGLRAAELADLLDVTEGTVSRWENDHAPVDRAAWAALAAVVTEKLAGESTTLDRLRASKDPRGGAGPVRLRLAHG